MNNIYVKEVREAIKDHLGSKDWDWVIKEGTAKVIKDEDITYGDIVLVIEEPDSLNAVHYSKVKGATPDDDRLISLNDISSKFFYIIERLEDGKWVEVQNEEALQPVELIEKGILKHQDIVRFIGIDDTPAYEVDTDEEVLSDLNGLFFIGCQYDEYKDTVEAMMNADDDDDDDEDECECGHHHEEDGLGADLAIVPASMIIEYLRMYGPLIKKIGVEIDRIEAEEEEE